MPLSLISCHVTIANSASRYGIRYVPQLCVLDLGSLTFLFGIEQFLVCIALFLGCF